MKEKKGESLGLYKMRWLGIGARTKSCLKFLLTHTGHPGVRKRKPEDWQFKAKQPQSKFKDGLATTDPVSRDKTRTKQGWGYNSVTELLLGTCKASGSVSGNPKTKQIKPKAHAL